MRLLTGLCIGGVVLGAILPLTATGQTAQDEELKRLQNELAIQTAKNELFSARFPQFEGGKTGAVEGAEKLAGMSNQNMPRATHAVGVALARDLKPAGCGMGTVILKGRDLTEKVAVANSNILQLEKLESEVAKASGRPVTSWSLHPIVTAISAVASYIGMTRVDYQVSGAEVSVDQDWLIASMVSTDESLSSELFPDQSLVQTYVKKLDDLKTSADAITDAKKKKELLGRIEALRGAMLKPGADGVLPLVTTALMSRIIANPANNSLRPCIAIITDARASPLLLTKESIFSRGGKAYLHVPVQASAVVMTYEGSVKKLACRLATISTPITLSKLTDATDSEVPWVKMNEPVSAIDCLAGEVATADAKDQNGKKDQSTR